jgi:hypothetical protein
MDSGKDPHPQEAPPVARTGEQKPGNGSGFSASVLIGERGGEEAIRFGGGLVQAGQQGRDAAPGFQTALPCGSGFYRWHDLLLGTTEDTENTEKK